VLLRWFCRAKIERRAHIGWFSAVMGRQVVLGEHSVVRPFTLIKLTGDVRLGSYSEVSSFTLIYGSSSLIIGEASYVGPQSLINVDEEVRMGHGSALGPRSMVFTHGSYLPYTEGYWAKMAGVVIGNKVWCAAGVFLHPGVEIGDDCFVNSRSVVTRSIPSGSIVEGNPAKVIRPMAQVKRKMSPRRVDVALAQVMHDFCEIGLRRELGIETIIETVEASKHQIDFFWRGHAYRIRLVPSTGYTPVVGAVDCDPPRAESAAESAAGVRCIYLVNLPGWSAPEGAWVLDMSRMQTPFDSDHILDCLRLFMLRYYGIRFRDRPSP
jgi:acetyltransferase-like isoleucine patch superfamily enzyme